jgi:RNA polymerase sigma-70 factor (TIGR02960 family)
MTERTLARARAGDEDAFRALTDPFRRELHVHCYRMVGSLQDAEEMLQETLLAAWRGLDGFAGRASVRAWLYRIATNRCLNALRDRGRRPLPAMELPEPTRRADPIWLDPYPDAWLEQVPDSAPGPDARYEAKEAAQLAFAVALAQLPPSQRAALVLRDVLGFRAAEVADMLATSEVAVKGSLQRARAAVDAQLPDPDRAPLPDSPEERDLVARFTTAVQAGDVDAVVALMTDDAWLTMPPAPHEYQGADAIAGFLRDRAARRGGVPHTLVATRANGQPAFGAYLPPSPDPYGFMVLTLAETGITRITWFSATEIFPSFGLPG